MRFRVIIALLFVSSLANDASAAPVSFRNEVMAVLSRAGCNMGACHGNQNGKNGFKLSLRGEDPDFDYAVLSRGTLGRRTDPVRPNDSMILQKAICAAPHEGGQRFSRSSYEYSLLRRWIAEGLRFDSEGAPRLAKLEVSPRQAILVEPMDSVRLEVKATFSDGTVRDVTRLATFDPSNLLTVVDATGIAHRKSDGETTILVRYLNKQATVQLAFVPARPGFVWQPPAETNYIDHLVFDKLKLLRVQPSERCSDVVFLRRVYLDLIGGLPTLEETRRFLNQSRPDKRARLINELLERPEFDDFWALKWSDLLRNEEKALDKKGVAIYHDWIRNNLAKRVPLNEFARELIAARGSSYSNPEANYYRALREPETRAEATAQVFLGIRLQCAKCHNHPFEKWTQDDYHRFAALFSRVQYRIVENKRTDNLDKHEFIGEQIIFMDRSGETLHPRTKEILQPRLLGVPSLVAPNADRLQVLADWVADVRNPFFARAQANRIWAHLLGRGLVDPIDDFRDSNPPSNEALLDALANDLSENHFDLRHLVKTIVNSTTYQLSDVPNETNRDDETNFSHSLVRSLQAEQLLDAVAQVTGSPLQFNDVPAGTKAIQLPGAVSTGRRKRGQRKPDTDLFLTTFGKPLRSLSCECERSEDTTLAQAFQLITGPMLNRMLADPDNRLGKLLASKKGDEEIVNELYTTALCRPPNAKELEAGLELMKRDRNRRNALEDLTWALINSKEFLLRR